jgi:hypothetical protein
MDALYSLTANESSNIDMNQLERKILRGNQKCTGDVIYKIRSSYDYLLVAATSLTPGSDFTIDGQIWDKAEKKLIYKNAGGTVNIFEGDTTPSIENGNQYILMTNGQELVGRFSEVKVLDGTGMIYGVGLEDPIYHFSLETELSNSPALESFGGDPSGLIYWLDASDDDSFLLSVGNTVAQWKNKVKPTEKFVQGTGTNRPTKTTVDFSSPYGASASTPGVVFDGIDNYMQSSDSILFDNMINHQDYYTVAMVISGPSLIDGVILDSSGTDGSGLYSNYRFEVAHNGSNFAGWGRCIGYETTVGNSSYELSVDLRDRASIIIHTVGHDTELAASWPHIDYVFSDSNAAETSISTYNYGNYYNSGFGKFLGAGQGSSAIERYFEGYIHELMIFNNKLSISQYGDYNLNLEQIDSIGRYLDRKWLNGTQWLTAY